MSNELSPDAAARQRQYEAEKAEYGRPIPTDAEPEGDRWQRWASGLYVHLEIRMMGGTAVYNDSVALGMALADLQREGWSLEALDREVTGIIGARARLRRKWEIEGPGPVGPATPMAPSIADTIAAPDPRDPQTVAEHRVVDLEAARVLMLDDAVRWKLLDPEGFFRHTPDDQQSLTMGHLDRHLAQWRAANAEQTIERGPDVPPV